MTEQKRNMRRNRLFTRGLRWQVFFQMSAALNDAFFAPAFIIAKLITFAAIPIGNIARAVEFCGISRNAQPKKRKNDGPRHIRIDDLGFSRTMSSPRASTSLPSSYHLDMFKSASESGWNSNNQEPGSQKLPGAHRLL